MRWKPKRDKGRPSPELAMPLAELTPAELEALNALLARTLRKTEVLASVQTHLKPVYQG